MKPNAFADWAEPVIRQSPAVASVTRAPAADPPLVSVVELATGAHVHVQWVRSSPPKPEDPNSPVTGQPPAPVKVPELATSGRLRTADIEQHLAALINNAGHNEILDVTGYSVDPALGSDDQPCGIRVRCHDESVVYGLFRHTLPRGATPVQGGELKQREEV